MPRRPDQVALSVRINADVAARARLLVRNNAGSPMFLKLGAWVQAAIEAHIAATEAELAERKRPVRRSQSPSNHL